MTPVQTATSDATESDRSHTSPLRVAGLYLAFGILWILASDLMVRGGEWAVDTLFWMQVAKGIGFVTLSAAFLYTLVRREMRAVAKTSELLHAVCDGATDAIFVKDLKGRYILFNPAAARFVGKTPPEVIGKDDTALFGPDDAKMIMDRDRRVIQGGVAEVEEERLNAGGVDRVFLATKTPYRDDEGRVVGIIGISVDITEWKRAEEALREREALSLAILETTSEGYWMFDAEGRILDVNEAYVRQSGYSRDELLSMRMAELEAAMTPDEVLAKIAHIRSEGQDRFESLHRAKDGSVWPIEIMAAYRPIAGGRWFGFGRDITHRKETEKSLALLGAAATAAANGIVITDRAGTIVWTNPAFTRITGYTEEEAIGQNPRFLKSGRQSPGFYSDLWSTISKGEVWTGIVMNRRKNGELYDEEMSIAPLIGADGAISHFIAIKQDVTGQRLLEQRLHQAQKMEAIGQLAGGVAHDFNNLLTIISGYSELLLSMLSPNDPKRASVKAINEAGDRAAGLTRQLLAFSRKAVVEPRIVDLNEIIRETEKMLRRMIGEDVILSTTLEAENGQIKIDPGQMGQVLLNMAVNARDAMPQGGTLTIQTQSVEIDEAHLLRHPGLTVGPRVLLRIADTGIGMTPEVRAHIFEPFFTTKEAGKGTGLGLATAYGIVQQSGGHIEVESEPGVGTTFSLYFPQAEEPQSASFHSSPESAPRGAELVLFVEDELSVRKLGTLALQTHGYTVLDADSADKALQLDEANPGAIRILVTDVVMPGMGGHALADILRTRRPGLKVLFLSGYTDDAVIRHGIQQAEVAFLQKPYTPVSLARKVREVLDSE